MKCCRPSGFISGDLRRVSGARRTVSFFYNPVNPYTRTDGHPPGQMSRTGFPACLHKHAAVWALARRGPQTCVGCYANRSEYPLSSTLAPPRSHVTILLYIRVCFEGKEDTRGIYRYRRIMHCAHCSYCYGYYIGTTIIIIFYVIIYILLYCTNLDRHKKLLL